MKKALLLLVLLCAAPARAEIVADVAAPPAPAVAALPGWYPLHTFSGGHWKLGLDASATMGACVERELGDGQWLVGPCRDILLLAKDSSVAFHLGVAAMSNAERGNTAFQLRAGFNVGPVARSLLAKTVDRIPVLERVTSWNLPPWMNKLADMTTLDFAGGPRPFHDASVDGLWTYGVAAKIDLPVDVLVGWLKSGL